MAYASAELNMVAQAVGSGSGGSHWTYINSAEDAVATVRGADYFSDGSDKGMKVGDLITSCGAAGVGQVYKVDAVTAGGAATVT